MPTDVVRDGLTQPTMWIIRDPGTMRAEGWPPSEIDGHQITMHAVFDNLAGDGYFVQVPGMFHANLSDYPLVSPLLRNVGLTGPIDAHRAHDIVNAYSLAFFDRHLANRSAPLLDGPSNQYLEVRLDIRQQQSR